MARMAPVCACCKRNKKDAKPRADSRVDPTQRLLCDACWKDPAISYAACWHGLPAPGAAVRHPEYGSGEALRYDPARGVCVRYPRQPTFADGIYHHPSAFVRLSAGSWEVRP